jgi:hypothetical protein
MVEDAPRYRGQAVRAEPPPAFYQERREARPDLRQGRAEDRGEWRQERRQERLDRWRDRAEAQENRAEQRRDWQRDRQADRRDWQRDRQDDRRDWDGRRDRQDGRWQGRDGRDGRGWDDRRGWDDGRGWADGRGGWNRDWRRDRRYDWQDWRFRNRDAFRLPPYRVPPGFGYRRFGPGATLAPPLFNRRYWLLDPWAFHLPPAWGPHRWVRFYDDVLLVDIRTGRVLDFIPRFFW